MSLAKDLLEILACPKCKAGIIEQDDWIICQNSSCGLRYPVRNGIPVMLIDEAQKSEK